MVPIVLQMKHLSLSSRVFHREVSDKWPNSVTKVLKNRFMWSLYYRNISYEVLHKVWIKYVTRAL